MFSVKRKKPFYGCIIVLCLVLFIVIIFYLGHKYLDNVYADDEIMPFIGQDSQIDLEQKEALINYTPGIGNIPMLTVLIPDINEDASAWSNNYLKDGYSYNKEYLPEQIKSSNDSVHLYTAIFYKQPIYNENHEEIGNLRHLYITDFSVENNINNESQINNDTNTYQCFNTDIDYHRVIMLNFSNTDIVFEDAYYEVNMLITLALYDLQKLTNLNATVNIVGHGRGGLLGIKYANEHPTAVNALYNIGTPHNGSTSIRLLQSLERCGININSIKQLFGGSSLYEIADSNSALLSQLKNDWNNNTLLQNPYIKAYAYAGVINYDHFSAISELSGIANYINQGMSLDDYLWLLYNSKSEWTKKYLGKEEYDLISSLVTNAKDENGNDYHKPFIEIINDWNVVEGFYNIYYEMIASKYYEAINDGNEIEDTGRLDDWAGIVVIPYIKQGIGELINLYNTFITLNTNITFMQYIESLQPNVMTYMKIHAAKTVYSFLHNIFTDDELFNNTDELTIGEYLSHANVSIDFINDVITQKNNLLKISKYADIIADVMKVAPTILGAASIFEGGFAQNIFISKLFSTETVETIVQNCMPSIIQFLGDIKLRDNTDFDDDGFSWFFNDEILFMNDFIVDYGSQIAQGYQGFICEKKIFTNKEVNINRSSFSNTILPIAHYLETMDPYFINLIMNKLEINESNASDYNFTIDKWKGEVTITGLRNETLKESNSLIIPSEIQGYIVTRISEYAFKECKLSSVTLPDYLEEIGECAFLQCNNLTTIVLPSSIRKIGNNAFEGCPLTGTINIGANMISIGEFAFGMGNIWFNVDESNERYSSENGTLYNKVKSLLIKYGGIGNSFNVPISVVTIEKCAFYGNQDLLTINTSSVHYIEDYAFYNSNIVTINGISALEYIGEYALEGTPWITNNTINGFVSINGLLIRYIDVPNVTEAIIPSNITRVMSKAFKGSEIESLIIPANVENIGSRILENCLNITKVKFLRQSAPGVGGCLTDGTGKAKSQLKIYVPYEYHSYYENSSLNFYNYNGPFYYICKVYYQDFTSSTYFEEDEYIDEDLPLSLRLNGANNTGGIFVGWSDNPNIYNEVQFINSAEADIYLYAFYQYTITFILNNEEPNIVYNVVYNDYFTFPMPTKEGYYLSGWSNNTNMGSYNADTTNWQLTSNGNWIISANWLPNRYELIIEENGNWWIYVDGDSHPIISSEQHYINFGDEINISELISLYKSNGIGFKVGHTLIGFSFEVPLVGGPSNASPISPNATLTIPYLGEDGSSISIVDWEDNNIPAPNNAPPRLMSYYLYAIYDIESYYINCYVNNQLRSDLSHTYEYGDLLTNLGYISNLHCDFIEWGTQSNGIILPTNSYHCSGYDTITLYDFTPNIDLCLDESNSINLYAVIIRRCEVVFKNYDGAILKTEYVRYGENATPPVNPTRMGYSFNCWSNSFINVKVEHLQCVAVFQRMEVTIQNNYSGTKRFTDIEAVYVDCTATTNGATYLIASSVKVITFEDKSNHGILGLFSHQQKIEVESRNTPITIILINYYGYANDTNNGIKGNGSTINLYCKGYNVLTGGVLSQAGQVLDYSSAGIYSNTINITGDSGATLMVLGGIGKDGDNGTGYNNVANDDTVGSNGKDGSNGYDGGYGIVCVNLHISNINVIINGGSGGAGGAGGKGQQSGRKTAIPGYGTTGYVGLTGGSGGNGGNGGNGKAAVLLYGGTFSVDSTANVTLSGGDSGSGGAGGAGGKGGKGGKGGPGKFGKSAAKGGKGGTGGTGGAGGNSGTAGGTIVNVLGTLNFASGTVTMYNGTSGSGGNGGTGGAGGDGGEGGTKWPTGNLAATGDTGNSGANGSHGNP